MGFPWTGEMDLPPFGLNHSYAPVAYTKPDGTPGLKMRKVRGWQTWVEAQMLLLRQQGLPRIAPDLEVAIMLDQRLPNERMDADAFCKGVLDCLAHAFSMGQERAWNDRFCRLLVLTKTVDKEHPGITVTIVPYVPAQRALLSSALTAHSVTGAQP